MRHDKFQVTRSRRKQLPKELVKESQKLFSRSAWLGSSTNASRAENPFVRKNTQGEYENSLALPRVKPISRSFM